MVKDGDVERVRQATSIVDVVGQYVPLKRAGKDYKAICPFHQEKTPSFNVSPTKQIYKCFGCGQGGDVFSFIMQTENLEFPEAVEFLARRAGIQLQEESPRLKALYDTLERAARFYHMSLLGSPAEEYLQGRGIDENTSRQFNLGYSPDSSERGLIADFVNHPDPDFARKQMQELIDAGLVKKGGRFGEDSVYEFFRHRLMFPITDFRGRTIGFGARDLGYGKIKYLNSPESELFRKSNTFYGQDKALKPAREQGRVIVVEGYTDVVHCHQTGLANVIGTMGTALTDEHVQVIERRFPGIEVVFLFDSDMAGKNAALRAGEKTFGRLNARIAFLPKGYDPAQILEEGTREDLEYHLDRSLPFFDFFIDEKIRGRRLDSLEARIAFLTSISGNLKKIPQSMAGVFADTIAEKTRINRESVLDYVFGRTLEIQTPPETAEEETKEEQRPEKIEEIPEYEIQIEEREPILSSRTMTLKEQYERRFLQRILANPKTISYFAGKLSPRDFFSCPEAREIFVYATQEASPTSLMDLSVPLFHGMTRTQMLGEIQTRARNRKISLDALTLKSFLQGVEEAPRTKLREIEREYLVIQSINFLYGLIGSLSRGKSLKELEDILQQSLEKLRK